MNRLGKSCLLLLTIIFSLSVTSCDKDEEKNEPYLPVTYSEDNNNGGSTGGTPVNESTIRNNVTVDYTFYADSYDWIINIKTKLASVYPTKTINYGYECGYGTYNDYIILGDDSGAITIVAKLLFGEYASDYLIRAIENLEKKKREEPWYMTDDDEMKYKEAKAMLESNLRYAKREYRGRVFVEIDNVRYYIKDVKYQ